MTVVRGVMLAAFMAGAGFAGVPFSPTEASAQTDFGQNQVQYRDLNWQILPTEHFLVYFYPEEGAAARNAARMAERDYARLSRVFNREFTEKKPIMLFASRADFAQNNVTGDLGEGTGGVTEALRHRMLLNFTGDYGSFEHVLTHEMTHAFQYDVFARGKAGNGMQALAEHPTPLWFAEGMAEYFSLGPTTTQTEAWMRDAALNGKIPSVQQMTDEPEKYFPYRFGHSFWAYVGHRWGDASIGLIMAAVPAVGVERAFKRVIGMDLDDIGTEWRIDLQTRLLPQTGSLDRPSRFAVPLLSAKKTGGEIFLAPALSPDGTTVAFLSNRGVTRGQLFIDLWLGDGETGARAARLVPSMVNAGFEELGILYSQSAFSPDGKRLAFTAQRGGKDVLYVFDVASRSEVKRLDLPLESSMGPSWSPDGSRLVFSGSSGGTTDLYVVTIANAQLERLTNDSFADEQPQWSPDGKTIAFATDRGAGANLALLHFPKWQVALYSLDDRMITVIPGQSGLNTNPQWSPNGRSLAYVSDRTGIANVFLYDLDSGVHYQITSVVGAVSAITEYSPSISWARGADRLAFTYYDNGTYSVWTIGNPRALARTPYHAPQPVVVAHPVVVIDSARGGLSDSDTTVAPVSVQALLDSVTIGLGDTTSFRVEPVRLHFQPDYVARPTIGYAPDSYGRTVFGGTSLTLSDLLGNNRLTMSLEINGRLSESRVLAGYTNLSHRLQYSGGVSQSPYYFITSDSVIPTLDTQIANERQVLTIDVARQAFAVATYPFNRFARVELSGGVNSVLRHRWFLSREIVDRTAAVPLALDSIRPDSPLNYFDGQLAYVSDNAVFGTTGPVMGHRYRVSASPVIGSLKWMEYMADYRRYDPVFFNNVTIATRFYSNVAIGPDETAFPKYIARSDFVRGYDRNNAFYLSCPVLGANTTNCNQVELLGSRVMVANMELRFPLVRRLDLGVLPVSLPPLDGLFFYDAGVAWSRDQSVYGARPKNYDAAAERYPLRSYGFGLRLNLFDFAVLRWDYAKPLDQNRKAFWSWSLWPSF